MSNQKVGLDYFPLDVDIEQDDKIALIQAKYGAEGFSAIIKLLAKIYADKGYYYEWNDKTSLLFAGRINIEHTKMKEIISDAIEWELFDKEKFQKYQILTSKRIQRTYLEATKRRKRVDIIKRFLVINGEDINILNNNVNIIDENVDILKQSKVKESKVKESKVKESKVYNCSDIKDKSEQKYKISFNFSSKKWENITEEDKEIWKEAYPACNIDQELSQMKAWIISAGAKGHKSNWHAFINRWLKNSQDKGGTKNVKNNNWKDF